MHRVHWPSRTDARMCTSKGLKRSHSIRLETLHEDQYLRRPFRSTVTLGVTYIEIASQICTFPFVGMGNTCVRAKLQALRTGGLARISSSSLREYWRRSVFPPEKSEALLHCTSSSLLDCPTSATIPLLTFQRFTILPTIGVRLCTVWATPRQLSPSKHAINISYVPSGTKCGPPSRTLRDVPLAPSSFSARRDHD